MNSLSNIDDLTSLSFSKIFDKEQIVTNNQQFSEKKTLFRLPKFITK